MSSTSGPWSRVVAEQDEDGAAAPVGGWRVPWRRSVAASTSRIPSSSGRSHGRRTLGLQTRHGAGVGDPRPFTQPLDGRRHLVRRGERGGWVDPGDAAVGPHDVADRQRGRHGQRPAECAVGIGDGRQGDAQLAQQRERGAGVVLDVDPDDGYGIRHAPRTPPAQAARRGTGPTDPAQAAALVKGPSRERLLRLAGAPDDAPPSDAPVDDPRALDAGADPVEAAVDVP